MIDLEAVSFRYGRRSPALFTNLSLHLPAGTICGLLGANGAGKSTLLGLMAGLHFPQGGRCRVLEREPRLRSPDFLADVFLLPEEFQLPLLSPATYGARYGALYPRFDTGLFQRLLEELQIPQGQKLGSLSQGQKKKFLLAFGIATQARVLILDEPTNGLDIPSKNLFRRMLIDHFDPVRSFLISTHQAHDLQGLIDSVMVLAQGGILLHETVENLESRLTMTVESRQPVDALYSERALEGFKVVRHNESGDGSQLDLEMLFGLATSGPESIRGLLRREVA